MGCVQSTAVVEPQPTPGLGGLQQGTPANSGAAGVVATASTPARTPSANRPVTSGTPSSSATSSSGISSTPNSSEGDSGWGLYTAGGGGGSSGTPTSSRAVGTLGDQPTPIPHAVRVRSPSIFNMHEWDSQPGPGDGAEALPSLVAPPVPLCPTPFPGRLQVTKLGGCTFVNQYLVIQYLGKGSSGRVFLCMDVMERRLYAVKILRKDGRETRRSLSRRHPKAPAPPPARDPMDDLRREIAAMRAAASHPNVVALREVVDDVAGHKMLIVMQYCEGGPVLTRQALEAGRCIPESVARSHFRDMAQGLAHLHSRRVVHGDLKPENALMMASGRVALSDFGCSKVLGEGQGDELERCNGTPAFLAPEMMQKNAKYRGWPVDLYALGACLFTFVFGRIPFKAPSVAELFRVVQSQPLEWPAAPAVSPELRHLVEGLLCKDPGARMTMAQVAAHPWVTDGARLPPLAIASAQGSAGTRADSAEIPMTDNNAAGLQQQQQQQVEQQQQQGSAAVEMGLGLASGNGSQAGSGGGGGGGDELSELLSPELSVHTFAPGEVLMRQGDRGRSMLYILQGEVQVHYLPHATPAPHTLPSTTTAPAPVNPATPATPVAATAAATTPKSTDNASTPLAPASTKASEPQSGELRVQGASPSPQGGEGEGIGALTPSATSGSTLGASLSATLGPTPARNWPLEPPTHWGTSTEAAAAQSAHKAAQYHLFTPAAGLRVGKSALGMSGTGLTPRLQAALAAGATPDGSPRLPPDTSFHPSRGPAAATGAAFPTVLESGLESSSFSTTATPLPSARRSESLSAALTLPPLDEAADAGGLHQQEGGEGDASDGEDGANSVSSPEVWGGGEQEEAAAVHDSSRITPEPGNQAPTGGGDAGQAGAGGEDFAEHSSADKHPYRSPDGPATYALVLTHDSVASPGPPGSRLHSAPISPGPISPLRVQLVLKPVQETPAAAAGDTEMANGGGEGVTLTGRGSLLEGPAQIAGAAAAAAPQREGKGAAAEQSCPVGDDRPAEEDLHAQEDLERAVLSQLLQASAACGHILGSLQRGGEFLVAVRRAGDVIGEMESLGDSSARRCASVNAGAREVRVALLPHSHAKSFLRHSPLAKQQLAEMSWARQSENIVLEALLRLAMVKADLEAAAGRVGEGAVGASNVEEE